MVSVVRPVDLARTAATTGGRGVVTRSSGRHRPPMVSVNGEMYEGDVAPVALTAEQVTRVRFRTRWRGLDPRHVAAYLARVAAELRRRDQRIARLSDELSLLKQALRDWQSDQARLPYVGELDIDPGT